MSDSPSAPSAPSVQAEKAFTPGSGCKAGPGTRCGGEFLHTGGLTQRPDGTWSCRHGFARSREVVACTCGCGTFVHPKDATTHRVNPEAVEHFVKGGIVRPKVRAEGFPRFLRVVREPSVTILAALCAGEIAATVNYDDAKRVGCVRTTAVASGGDDYYRLFVTQKEIEDARRKRTAPIADLIARVLAGKFVKRGEPEMVDGVRQMPCTTAVNGLECFGTGWSTWDQMPAWSSPDGRNSIGFCAECAAAIVHRFPKPHGMLRDLVQGGPSSRPADEESLGKLQVGAARPASADDRSDDVKVVLTRKTPIDDINATRRLAEGHLPAPRAARVEDAIKRLFKKKGAHGITWEDAREIEAAYGKEIAEMEAEDEKKAEARSDGHRAASVAATDESWGRCKKLLKAPPILATDEDFRTALEGLPSNASVKTKYEAVVGVAVSRKASEARLVVITEAVNAGMFENISDAKEAFEQDDLEAMKAKIKAFWLEKGVGTEAEVAAILPETPSVEATPGPRGSASDFARLLAANGRFQMKARSGADRSDPNYGAAKAAPPKNKGGDKNKKEGKSQGRGSRGPGKSSKEGAAAAAAT